MSDHFAATGLRHRTRSMGTYAPLMSERSFSNADSIQRSSPPVSFEHSGARTSFLAAFLSTHSQHGGNTSSSIMPLGARVALRLESINNNDDAGFEIEDQADDTDTLADPDDIQLINDIAASILKISSEAENAAFGLTYLAAHLKSSTSLVPSDAVRKFETELRQKRWMLKGMHAELDSLIGKSIAMTPANYLKTVSTIETDVAATSRDIAALIASALRHDPVSSNGGGVPANNNTQVSVNGNPANTITGAAASTNPLTVRLMQVPVAIPPAPASLVTTVENITKWVAQKVDSYPRIKAALAFLTSVGIAALWGAPLIASAAQTPFSALMILAITAGAFVLNKIAAALTPPQAANVAAGPVLAAARA